MARTPLTSRLPGQEDSADSLDVRFAGGAVTPHEEALFPIRRQLPALAEEPGGCDVFLDFGNVEYLTSTTPGTLIRLHKRPAAGGGRLTTGRLKVAVRLSGSSHSALVTTTKRR